MADPRRHESAHGPMDSDGAVEEAEPADAVTHGDERGDWEFDDDVADVFDTMLERSIPQYGLMRETVTEVAIDFFEQGSSIVDLGSSLGGAVEPLVGKFGAQARGYHLVERSPAMIERLRERFSGLLDTPSGPIVRIHDHDLRDGLPDAVLGSTASVALSVLTLQFVPINYRQRIVQEVYDSLNRGGAFVLVEKVLGEGARLNEMMVEHYHRSKVDRGGYSPEEVRRKALSLEGELVPATERWNRDLLRQAGFRPIDCFWRWHNFGAWVAVKR